MEQVTPSKVRIFVTISIKGGPMTKMPQEEKDSYSLAMEALKAYLGTGDHILTFERKRILSAVMEQTHPFIVPTLHQAVQQLGTRVSITTIYNTLNLFCKAGITVKLALPQGTMYLASAYCHNRLVVVCNECGKVIYLHRYKLYEQLLRTIVPRFHKVRPVMLSFGYCQDCKRKLFSKKQTKKN